MIDTKRQPNESLDDYMIRLYEHREECGMTSQEVARLLNAERGSYQDESTYRKDYSSYKRWREYFASKQVPVSDEMRQLAEERVRVRDERNELNRLIRENARNQGFWDELRTELTRQGCEEYPSIPTPCQYYDESRTLLVCLSDVHFGLRIDSPYGEYNPDVARRRLAQYLCDITDALSKCCCDRVVLALLGDMVSGNIHVTTRISNVQNVIGQVKSIGELLADFTYKLSIACSSVTVISVSGNHSRVDKYKEALNDERLDNLIPWYLSAKLAHLNNLAFYDAYELGDSTLCRVNIEGREYWFVHGDNDEFSQAGAYKLVSFVRSSAPYAIIYGHDHTARYLDGEIKLLSSGSLCGSGDDHTVKKRLSGAPCQLMCVLSKRGLEQILPITLD